MCISASSVNAVLSVETGHPDLSGQVAPSLHEGTRFSFLFLILLTAIPSFAQEEIQYGMNGFWKVEGERVKITYELYLPVDKTYEVHLVMRKDDDTSFVIIPKAVEGAIGRVEYKGGVLEVVWDYRKDMQTEPEGKFRFDFDVKEIAEESSWRWWHYAAGGAALVAGTIIAINAGAKDETQTTLPGPPRIRP